MRHLAMGRTPPETDHPLSEDGRVDEGLAPEQVPEPGMAPEEGAQILVLDEGELGGTRVARL